MGIIAKQSIKGSFYTYLGVILGFLTTGILMPKFFTTEQVGLTNVIIAQTLLLSQFATLGFTSVNTRIFPYFRNGENGHNGLLTLGLVVTFIGILLSIVIFFVFESFFLSGASDNTVRISQYSLAFITLIFFSSYYLFLDTYAKALLDSVIGTFLRDFVVKLLNLFIIALYIFNVLNFNQFVISYITVYILPALILVWVLIKRGDFVLSKPDKLLFNKHKKELVQVALFGIISGFSGVAIVNIDTVITNYYLGLGVSGVYSIIFFTATLIIKPSISLRKISSIVIAEAWKKNDTDVIETIYRKSTVNQTIIGLFLFGGIALNLHVFFDFLPDYSSGKTALLILLTGFLIEMLSGVSGVILGSSEYYKFSSILSFISTITLAVSCLVLIPNMGINGTATAVSLNYVIFFVIRFYFLKKRYGFQPYGKKHLLIFFLFEISFFSIIFIPQLENIWLDFVFKSLLFSLTFIVPVYSLKISEDLNKLVGNIFSKIFKK